MQKPIRNDSCSAFLRCVEWKSDLCSSHCSLLLLCVLLDFSAYIMIKTFYSLLFVANKGYVMYYEWHTCIALLR